MTCTWPDAAVQVSEHQAKVANLNASAYLQRLVHEADVRAARDDDMRALLLNGPDPELEEWAAYAATVPVEL